MIELIFIACLKVEPDTCQQRVLGFVGGTPAACARRAQPELAVWADTHPAFAIASWKCADGETRERDA